MIDDPTRTATLRNNFARRLVAAYGRRLDESIRALRDLNETADIEAPAKLSRESVNWRIDEIYGTSFNNELEEIVRLNIPNAYRPGVRRAIADLRRSGVRIEDIPHGYTVADLQAIAILHDNGLTLCKTLSSTAKKEAKRIINEGVLNGKGTAEIAREMRTKIGPLSKNRASMIARTEVIRAYNQGARVQYEHYGVKRFVWLSAASERTCPECEDLDGTEWAFDEHDPPPLHPMCRCSMYPVVE